MPMGRDKKEYVPFEPDYSPERLVWVKGEHQEFIVYENEDGSNGEPGAEVSVAIHQRAQKISIKLTNLTADELDAMQVLFMEAFAVARDVVDERDAEANERFQAGEPPRRRLYRRSPILVHRTGAFREYSSRLRERLARTAELAGTAERVSVGPNEVLRAGYIHPVTRRDVPTLAELESPLPVSVEQDNGTETSQSESIREVRTDPELPGGLQGPGTSSSYAPPNPGVA